MTRFDFAQAVAQEVNGVAQEVERANGTIRTAVSVKTSGNASPLIYVDSMYDQGLTVEEAAADVREIIEKEGSKNLDMQFFKDFEQIKPMLRARLYNKATTADVSRVAADPFNDLIITAWVSGIKVGDAVGAIKVKAEHLDIWNVTADEVLDIAESNSRNDAMIMSMAEILKAMGYPGPIEDDGTMYVISNESKSFGAYSILALMDDLKARFKDGFTVLPSSVHEVIVVPMDDQKALDSMVQEVNDTQVDYAEQLSNHSYRIAA